MFGEISDWLSGKKTYVLMVIGLIGTWLSFFLGEPVAGVGPFDLGGAVENTFILLAVITGRSALSKAESSEVVIEE